MKAISRAGPRAAALFAGMVLALAIMLLSCWLLREPVAAFVYRQGTVQFDATALAQWRAWATPASDWSFVTISLLGSPVAMTIIAIGGAGLLARRQAWPLFAGWVGAFGGSSVLAVALKHVFQRARPTGAHAYLHAVSYSFPSTHTLTSTVGLGIIAYTVARVGRVSLRVQTLVYVGAAALAAAVGASRLALGVHYVSDVLAGELLGLLWLVTCIALLEAERRGLASST